jgi:hypothetical protein
MRYPTAGEILTAIAHADQHKTKAARKAKREEKVGALAAAAATDARTTALGASMAIDAARKARDPRYLEAEQRKLADERARRELGTQERTILQRLSPRRNPWPELDEHDRRLLDLDLKLAQAGSDVRELEEQLETAAGRDQAQLAEWFGGGEQGPRPAPTVDQARERLQQRRADATALQTVTDEASEERARFVEKNRDRLAAHADKLADQQHRRYLELLDELGTTREDLIALAAAARFARRYPDPTAAAEVPTPLLLQLQPGQRTLAWTQVDGSLRADAERLASDRGADTSTGTAAWVSRDDDARLAFAENKARLGLNQ